MLRTPWECVDRTVCAPVERSILGSVLAWGWGVCESLGHCTFGLPSLVLR